MNDTYIYISKGAGADAAGDSVLYPAAKYKELCQALALALNTDKGGTVIFIDQDNEIYFNELLSLGVIVEAPSDPDITLDT